MRITLNHYLILSSALFVMGFAGVVLRRNALIVLMSIELMLNAVNLSFVAFSRQLGNLDGQIAAFFVIVLAAAEAAVGLAILVLVFRRRATVQTTALDALKDARHVD
ncbi:MAG TPA: NADH-quinone oxidoreductase subunit NuoK [Deltaproteobacteria bacterium]|nr:NADH-quinone oxidoreductase subunit NuoK [Deltaproteobacteria bacterium]